MYNIYIAKEILLDMKRLAIILGLLMFAPASFAGGTTLYMDGADGVAQPLPPYEETLEQPQYDNNSMYFTEDGGVYGVGSALNSAATTKRYVGKTTKKVRIGTWKNDPNVYWNFGAVNFGSGFTTTSGGDKKY